MSNSVGLDAAVMRYLSRYALDAAPVAPAGHHWADCVVLPAFREQAALLARLAALPARSPGLLVILVMNRPEGSDPHANRDLREAVARLPPATGAHALPVHMRLHELAPHNSVLLLDLEASRGALPARQGVGLARRLGADLALHWMATGAIASDWIAQCDADATLPSDYFTRLHAVGDDTAAAVFPYRHTGVDKRPLSMAAALYEYRLHHYVNGLSHAGSPYAYHTLGSCMAVRAGAYSRVRGAPIRAAGEDFHLLAKLAKVGRIARLDGACIELSGRASDRVPFGTGPAVRRLEASVDSEAIPLFEHPDTFCALKAVLEGIPFLYEGSALSSDLLVERGLKADLARACIDHLRTAGVGRAISHCTGQSHDLVTFERHWHQWLDSFRSLKLLRALGASCRPMLCWRELKASHCLPWEDSPHGHESPQSLLRAVRQRAGWL